MIIPPNLSSNQLYGRKKPHPYPMWDIDNYQEKKEEYSRWVLMLCNYSPYLVFRELQLQREPQQNHFLQFRQFGILPILTFLYVLIGINQSFIHLSLILQIHFCCLLSKPRKQLLQINISPLCHLISACCSWIDF